MKHSILFGLTLLLFGAGYAQQFPVDCRILLSPPYSGVLTDYTQSPTRLRIQLTLRDLSQSSLPVSLRVRLLGPGLVMGNPPDFIQSRPIILSPGIPVTLSGLDLVEHFAPLNWNVEGLYDPQSPLPSGRYEWEVVAIELFRDRQVSNVGRAFWNWSSHLPPQLQGPLGDHPSTPGFLFSWRSRSFLPLNRAWYRLYLYELDDDDDPQFVVLSGAPPFRVIETGQTSYFYGPSEVPFTPGKRYAWRVQATDWQGETYFEQDGWSEAGSFRVLGPPCLAPKPTVFIQPFSAVELIWDPVPEVQRYEIQVQHENEIRTFSTDKPRWVLRQENPGDYTFRVQSVCGAGRVSAWTNWQPYVIPEEEEESWMSDPNYVYYVEPEPETNISDPSEDAKTDLARILDAPFEFLIVPAGRGCVDCEDGNCVVCEDTDHGDTDHGDTDHARAGTPTVLPVLSEATTVEQLEAIVKPLKPQCTGVVSDFSCGSVEEIPVYSGARVLVKPGDEVMMNTMKLQIVEIDAQGNGVGTVKVPMFGMAKVGVKLVNLKVAEGGCVVDGYAVTSDEVPLLVLNEKLKKNLQAIAVASQLVAEAGKTYAGVVAEKINDFRDGVDKIKAWAKGYQGGHADAGKAKAFQDFTQQASKAILENKSVPDSLKSALYEVQEKSKEAWAFFQTGKPCEVSGGGGGNHHKTFSVADCAGYAVAIEEEMGQLEQIRAVISCDCNWIRQVMEASNHCEELSDRLAKIRAVNQTTEKIYVEFNKPSFGMNSWQSRYVKIDGQCYGIRLTPMFVEGVADLDFKRFKKDRATQTIQVLDGDEKSRLEIKVLSGDWDKLDQYLGFSLKRIPDPSVGTSTEGKYVTGKQLKAIFPNTSQSRCDEVAGLINKYAEEYGLTTKERLAHFIGQIGAETQLKNLDEMSYSAKRILTAEKTRTIRTHNGKKVLKYCSLFSGVSPVSEGCPYPFCDEDIVVPEGSYHNGYASEVFMKGFGKTVKPRMVDELPRDPDFFSVVYACQLNNGGIESRDGYRFRGRGFIQITGQTNYQSMVQNKWNAVHGVGTRDFMCRSEACDRNLDAIANDLDFSMLISLTFWKSGNTNRLANEVNDESIRLVTTAVNGKEIGLPHRKSITKKAYEIFKK